MQPKKKILMVGGTWDKSGGKPSHLFDKLYHAIPDNYTTKLFNGGNYESLHQILEWTSEFDCVFWMPNVNNELAKVRNVKTYAPKTMLITSKRNDDNKYDTEDIILRALETKANLLIEFSRCDNYFNMRIIDPLGNIWCKSNDVKTIATATINRLEFLMSMTREKSYQVGNVTYKLHQPAFVQKVRMIAETIQELTPEPDDAPRFLGNASFRDTRCMKTFPSYRENNCIYVSKRNVSKHFLDENDFVPVKLENEKLLYLGDHKPSVDTPIQVRLYQALPNINYMIHTHCYVKDAPFTCECIPCGALEEVEQVLNTIEDRDVIFHVVNLRGHGSIIMSDNIEKFDDIKFYRRPMPEIQY